MPSGSTLYYGAGMKHWHIWCPHLSVGKVCNVYIRRAKCYYTKGAAHQAKRTPANMGNCSLPSLVLECGDPNCELRNLVHKVFPRNRSTLV